MLGLLECTLGEVLWYGVIAIVIYILIDRLIRIPEHSPRNHHILVTGCDTGFGHDFALKQDRRGAMIHAACYTDEGVVRLKEACSQRLHAFKMDVKNHESVLEGFKKVKETLPHGRGLWGIINNAGITSKSGPADWLSLKDYQSVFDVNFFGGVDVVETFLPLVKMERGRIVNTTSMYGRTAAPIGVPYSTSKYAFEAYSDCLRKQMRPFKVSVHIIEPGFFKTNLIEEVAVKRMLKQCWEESPTAAKEEYGQQYIDAYNTKLFDMLNLLASGKRDMVVKAYQHGLFGVVPRARYLIGWDARFLFIPIQALPEWLGDLLQDIMNYDGPTPDACKK